MYVLFFVLHITKKYAKYNDNVRRSKLVYNVYSKIYWKNLQVYNLQLVYNVTCNLELCTNRVWYTCICTNTPKKSYIDKIELP